MTKRLTITMVALVMFCLCLVVLPISALQPNPVTGRYNGSVIMDGAPLPTVFIGESGLNITPVLLQGGAVIPATVGGVLMSTKIGWRAGTFSFPDNPSQIIDVGTSYTNFEVSSATFSSYTGTWYLLTSTGSAGVTPIPVFLIADPRQAVSVVDLNANQGTGQDMSSQSVVRGTVLTFKLDTNLAAFTSGGRMSPIGGAATIKPGYVGTLDGGEYTNTQSLVPPVGEYTTLTPTASTTSTVNFALNPYVAGEATTTSVNVSFGDNSWSNFTVLSSPLNFAHTYAFPGTYRLTVIYNDALGNFNQYVSNDYVINVGLANINPATDGFMNVRIKDASGQISTRVFTNTPANVGAGIPSTTATSLTDLFVNTAPYYFGGFTGINGLNALGWDTGAIDPGTGTALYPAGTYTVWSETTLSHMKDNYRLNGADYSGKTVSSAVIVTLASDTVKIEVNKNTVVRSKPFSVTITGKPLTAYHVWVGGTSSMSGGYDDQPPMVGVAQEQVYTDVPNLNNNYPIGAYAYENSGTKTVRTDVAKDSVAPISTTINATRYYALVNTSSSGTRTVGFVTTNWTKDQQYTIRVSGNNSGEFREDEVDINVVKGAVTITASGDQSYYLGEDIKFTGTNTETQTTYLFLTGANLWSQGSQILNKDPRRGNSGSQVINGQANTFLQRSVNSDNTWDYTWGTASYALDAGTYTVYAVSQPNDAQNLGNSQYATISIVIKKPFVSASVSQSAVAQGDKLLIAGTAEGIPQQGVAIWILGKNYAIRQTQSINSDASFSYEVTTAATTGMDAGQYFVIVQHPMVNQRFDIDLCAGSKNQVCNLEMGSGGMSIFTMTGAGSLQGTDAAEALSQAINTPNVDDTYTKLVFLVEVPAIRIDAIGDKHIGDKFTITGTTNLAVDDEVLITVLSSSFHPTEKSQSGEFSGASGAVKVVKGDAGMNKISFSVDAATFKPDEYIVQADRVLQPKVMATAIFNVLEGSSVTPTPVVTTTVAPAPAVTTAQPTAAPLTTELPTTTKTPTQPGFGSLMALVGLGAVAFLIVRRH